MSKLCLLLLITNILFITLCISKTAEDKKIDRPIHKQASKDDENFFDIEQKDINGKTIDFERFVGYVTIVMFNIGKKGQDCDDINKILQEFYEIHNIFPHGVEFVIVPADSNKGRKNVLTTCPNIFKKLLSDQGVNYVLMEPVESEDKDHHPHAVYDYIKNLFYPRKILKDNLFSVVDPEGDVWLYNDVTSSQLKSILYENLRQLEKSDL